MGANGPVRTDGHPVGKPVAACVHPDAVDAYPLGAADVVLQVVADHPGLRRPHAQRFERMPEGSLVRLPDPELFLNLDVVEETVEAEPFDLSALIPGLAVGQQTQADVRLP